MRLPNAERATVPADKILLYLLSMRHPGGRYKAACFLRFGFTPDAWEVMTEALRQHAIGNEVSTVRDTPYGMKYTIEGSLQTPDGRNPVMRTVWFVEGGEEVPRFVTAYPC